MDRQTPVKTLPSFAVGNIVIQKFLPPLSSSSRDFGNRNAEHSAVMDANTVTNDKNLMASDISDTTVTDGTLCANNCLIVSNSHNY